MFEKSIKFIDDMLDNALLILFILLFLIGAYTMYDTRIIYNQTNANELRSFRPVASEDPDESWDLSSLSKDAVAWLTIDGTTIDYPIMQGVDNSEYLNKDPLGEYSLGGSIFLDSRNNAELTDPYSLVYGHHMEHGAMFGALDDYMDAAYLKAHNTGTVTTPSCTNQYRIFACVDIDAYVDEVFAPGMFDQTDVLQCVQANAVVLDDAVLSGKPEHAPLIAMSTCKFPETTERIVVFGYLEPLEE